MAARRENPAIRAVGAAHAWRVVAHNSINYARASTRVLLASAYQECPRALIKIVFAHLSLARARPPKRETHIRTRNATQAIFFFAKSIFAFSILHFGTAWRLGLNPHLGWTWTM